jgi:hypothetical protein
MFEKDLLFIEFNVTSKSEGKLKNFSRCRSCEKIIIMKLKEAKSVKFVELSLSLNFFSRKEEDRREEGVFVGATIYAIIMKYRQTSSTSGEHGRMKKSYAIKLKDIVVKRRKEISRI